MTTKTSVLTDVFMRVTQLTAENFETWKEIMQALLEEREYWSHIEGDQSIPPPKPGEVRLTDEKEEKKRQDMKLVWDPWWKVDRSVRTAIVLTLSPPMLAHSRPSTMTAKETWDKVCAVHQMKGTAGLAMLKRQLWKDIVYRNGTPMQSHIDQFTSVANKLADMGYPASDIDMACALLYSVPADWKVRQSITEKTLPINKVGLFQHVCNDFMQEERERELNRTSGSDDGMSTVEAFIASLGQKICTYGPCEKRVGHLESECFVKHPEKRKEWEAKKKQKGKGKGKGKQKALAATAESDNEEEEEKGVVRRNAYPAIVLDASVLHSRVTNLSSESWIVDSGASVHLCNSVHWFTSLSPCKPERISVANKETLIATYSGTVKFRVLAGDKRVTVSFSGVLFVPGIKVSLLSVPSMDKAGLSVSMGNGLCTIRNPHGEVIGSTERCGQSNLYRLDVKPVRRPSSSPTAMSVISEDSSQFVAFANTQGSRPVSWAVLHARLGHLHSAGMKQLLSDKMADGLVISSDGPQPDLSMCRGCIQGKSHRAPFPSASEHRATQLLELVHSDVAGPFSERTFNGFRFFVTFIDDFTRYVAVYLMHTKDDVLPCFKEWKGFAEKETGQRIGTLRCDGGGEYGIAQYRTGEFNAFRKEHSIKLHHSAADSPQQNGVAERANRTIMETARSMQTAAGLSKQFWGVTVQTAVHLRNRSPSKLLEKKTPFEAYFGKKPDLSYLRVFGCKAHALITNRHRDKLSPKTTSLTMVGYSDEVKQGLRLFNSETKKVVVRRASEVWCEEPTVGSLIIPTDTPAAEDTPSPSIASTPAISDTPFDEDAWEIEPTVSQPMAAVPESVTPPPVPSSGRIGTRSNPSPPLVVDRPLHSQEKKLLDFTQPSGTGKDIPSSIQRAHLSILEEGDEQHCLSVMAEMDESVSDPNTYQQAMSRPDWQLWFKAMTEELESTAAANTWTLVRLPDGRLAIGCKWVYKIKRKADGSVDRYKARLVAKGYSQKEGVDYTETFAPVARMSSLRTLLAVVAAEDLELHQMDVKTAFLNGDLTEDIYMQQPPGFAAAGQEDLVCKLNRSLYGLKQAGRSWYKKIDSALVGLDFFAFPADNCIYVQRTDEDTVYLLLYVDDLLLACRSLSKLTAVKEQLSSLFSMKDMGEAQYILGLQITRDRANRTLSLSQAQYIETVIQRFRMEDSHPESTPCVVGLDLRKATSPMTAEEQEKMKNVPYAPAVGAIMYAMLGTRPDIAYAVSVVSQFMHDPRPVHWKAVKRVLRYLKGTQHYKLTYGASESSHFHGYTDSNWGNDKGDRRSVCGYVFFLHGGAINWRARKQHSVALSSVEAEYVAACEAGRDAVHWRSFLSDLRSPLLLSGPTTIHCDNQGAIALSKNPEHHDRSKHIDITHHWIRQQVAEGVIHLDYLSTQTMIADVLTKPLTRDRHVELTKAMGVG
jgi:transposase InsO family protein